MAKKTLPKKKRPKSSRKTGRATFVRGVILLFLAGITAGSICLLKKPAIFPPISHKKNNWKAKTVTPPPSPPALKKKSVLVNLYFSDPNSDYLVMEPRRVVWEKGNVKKQMRIIVEELIKGPKGDLFQTIPSHVVIRDIKLKGNGTGIINFSRELSLNHPGGSLAEMHTIYSIVNSLLLNIPSLKQVQIQVEGKSPETLKGHIGCRSPFKANLSIIKTG